MVKETDMVVPGQSVARVGRTGRNKNVSAWNAHLHLEVWESDIDQKKFIFENNMLDGGYLQFDRNRFSANERSGMRRDPFRHDDTYTP